MSRGCGEGPDPLQWEEAHRLTGREKPPPISALGPNTLQQLWGVQGGVQPAPRALLPAPPSSNTSRLLPPQTWAPEAGRGGRPFGGDDNGGPPSRLQDTGRLGLWCSPPSLQPGIGRPPRPGWRFGEENHVRGCPVPQGSPRAAALHGGGAGRKVLGHTRSHAGTPTGFRRAGSSGGDRRAGC